MVMFSNITDFKSQFSNITEKSYWTCARMLLTLHTSFWPQSLEV